MSKALAQEQNDRKSEAGDLRTGLEANDQYGDTTVAEVEYRIVLSGS